MTKYKIMRYFASGKPSIEIKRDLTIEEAKEHCERDDTHKQGKWFDGYTQQ